MPLDNNFDAYWYDHMAMYFKRAKWTEARPLLPRRDTLTNKWLWIKPAMKGTRIITGPGTPVVETYWVDREEFLLYTIKYGK